MRSPEEVADEFAADQDTAPGWGMSEVDHARLAALIRARDAEITEQVRAETLAGFKVEARSLDDGYAGWSGDDRGGHAIFKPATHQRRLVGPWEPSEP